MKKYIESGILEAYVNGQLSETESREVDHMAEKYPEIKQEILEIIAARNTYAPVAKGPNPPKLENIPQNVRAENTSPSNPASSSQADTMDPASNKANSMWYLAAAALVLLIVSVSINLYLLSENDKLAQKVSMLSSRNDYLAQQYQATFREPEGISDPLEIIRDEQHLNVVLSGIGDFPDAKATVYWDPETFEVYMYPDQLPPTPSGKQYQLWAIINGVSIDAGIFDNNTQLQQLRKVIGPVEAFAVTLEDEGGNPIPTLDEMYVWGEIRG